MASLLLSRRDLDFLLYEWLDVEQLTDRPRFADHSRETFDAVMDLAEQIATRDFAPPNRRTPTEAPQFVPGRAMLHDSVAPAPPQSAASALVRPAAR